MYPYRWRKWLAEKYEKPTMDMEVSIARNCLVHGYDPNRVISWDCCCRYSKKSDPWELWGSTVPKFVKKGQNQHGKAYFFWEWHLKSSKIPRCPGFFSQIHPSESSIFSQFFPGEVPRFRRRKVLMPGPEIRSGGPLVAFAEKRVVDFFGLKMGLLLWSKNGLL